MKERLIIGTDIRTYAEPDDSFSLFHLLCFKEQFDILGFLITRPAGKLEAFNNIYKRLNADAKKYGFNKADYKIKLGATNKFSLASPHSEASRFIVKQAKQAPVTVLFWGSATDGALALRHNPEIKDKVQYFLGGVIGYNGEGDRPAYQFLKTKTDTMMIWTDRAGRGMNANAGGKYDNIPFVEQIIRPCGKVGEYLHHLMPHTTTKGLKWGDTQGVLFTMDDGWKDPTKPTMGGKFKQIKGTKHFEDLPNGSDYIQNRKARKMWEKRLKELYET